MSGLILVPLADNPARAGAPLAWSLELWGEGNPWFSAEDWCTFYLRAARADYSTWDAQGVDQELLYLGISEGEVVGAIALVDFDDIEEFRSLKPWVAAFVVDPEKRGTGIGSQMLEALEAIARGFGITALHLWTEDKKDFYLKSGYELMLHRDYPEISVDVLCKKLL